MVVVENDRKGRTVPNRAQRRARKAKGLSREAVAVPDAPALALEREHVPVDEVGVELVPLLDDVLRKLVGVGGNPLGHLKLQVRPEVLDGVEVGGPGRPVRRVPHALGGEVVLGLPAVVGAVVVRLQDEVVGADVVLHLAREAATDVGARREALALGAGLAVALAGRLLGLAGLAKDHEVPEVDADGPQTYTVSWSTVELSA